MDIYLVERFLVGWSIEEVDAMVRTIDDLHRELDSYGVRHLETIHIPGDETCLSVFVGPDIDTVRAANDCCALPAGRVFNAVTHGGRS